MADTMESLNLAAFNGSLALKQYDATPKLFPVEQVVLDRLSPLIEGRRILDIGIGAGRTTLFLLEISRDYTGIDYSEPLLEAAKRNFGLDRFFLCDARDLRPFNNSSFDFVMFSFNGLDYVAHEGRLTALREIHRVLAPGGYFLFSSHNRAWKRLRVFSFRHPAATLRPALRHLRMKRYERSTDEYEIRSDGLDYSLLNYYIGLEEQRKQLRGVGFPNCEVYDISGNVVTSYDGSPFLHYLVRK